MNLNLEAPETSFDLVTPHGDELMDEFYARLFAVAPSVLPLFPAERLPTAPAALEQRILAVEFRSADGRYWNATGGGATVAEAIIDARESCPNDATWDAIGWNDLYGE